MFLSLRRPKRCSDLSADRAAGEICGRCWHASQRASLVPSARALSGQLTINPNTVVKAFALLQGDNIIEPLRGRGMVVTPGAAAICKRHRDMELASRMGEAISEGVARGFRKTQDRSDCPKTPLQTCQNRSFRSPT